MKKKIIMLMLLVITTNVIVLVNPFKKKENKSEMLSILVEDTKGVYIENNNIDFKEGYNLNKIKSHCEKNSKLLWDKETKKLKVKSNESDKCYLYFDKERTGTENDPYEIQTIEDLVDLSNEVNAGDSKTGKYYVLVRDLDFSNPEDYEDSSRTDYGDINGINDAEALLTELTTGSGFIPIGGFSTKPFQGTFDGKYENENHKISNIFMENSGTLKASGFFGYVKNSKIINLIVSGKINAKEAGDFGGIAVSLNDSTIDNCINEINITGKNSSTGGLVGFILGNSVIKNSINKGNIKDGVNVGGLVGCIAANGKTLLIENSYNLGEVSATDASYVGGLIGRDNAGGTASLTINKSYNNGNITYNASVKNGFSMGGLLGTSFGNTIIKNSYNLKSIKNINNIYAVGDNINVSLGGLVGGTRKEITILNSYNMGNIEGGNKIGGILGTGTLKTKVIIDKCYNLGKLNNNIYTGWANLVGGLIGFLYEGDGIVINSYNEGEIVSLGYSSGLVGEIDGSTATKTNIKIINSFNKGNLDADTTCGVVYAQVNANSLYINNVYNIGKTIHGNTKYGISISNINDNKLMNTYYLNSEYNLGTNLNNDNVISVGLNENAMKRKTLVDLLNANIINDTTIKENDTDKNIKDIDPLLEGYTLAKWKLDENSYPTLDF